MTAAEARVVSPGLLRDWPLPVSDGDKDAKGRVLVVGGHAGVPGATLLAAEAALRAGAGKLQVAAVEPLAVALGIALPEAWIVGLPATPDGALAPEAADRVVELANDCAAVVLGPGFVEPDAARDLLARVVPRLDTAVCLDALGLSYLTGALDGVRHLAGRVVLSPNARELFLTLDRPWPGDPDDETLAAATADLAAATGAVVVSGAATSFIADPDGGLWSEDSGGSGMGVSGSGDVKAGIIGGLLARGCPPEQAAVWGAFVHGRSGERLASTIGRRGYLARELLEVIPQAFAEVES